MGPSGHVRVVCVRVGAHGDDGVVLGPRQVHC